jgi:hypothetical protein
MKREVMATYPKDPIDGAAKEMYDRRIGCLHVVDGEGPVSSVEVEMPNRLRSPAEVAGVVRDSGANVVSVLTPLDHEPGGASLIFRLGTIDPSSAV